MLKIILMRSLPGAGKTTMARELVGSGAIFATDDYWSMVGHPFTLPEAAAAHLWNQERTDKAMADKVSPVIIDNTNISLWEMKPYVLLADKHGYGVEIAMPNTPWLWDIAALARKTTHEVPFKTIAGMAARWDRDFTLEDIRNAKSPFNQEDQKQFAYSKLCEYYDKLIQMGETPEKVLKHLSEA